MNRGAFENSVSNATARKLRDVMTTATIHEFYWYHRSTLDPVWCSVNMLV